jgi:phage terminase large subunit GpA-like protein
LLILDPFESGWAEGWATDALLPLSDWADKNITLTSKDSSEPGPYRTARTPYVREIAECLSPYSPIETVVWMASAQIGKTRVGLNWIGYVIDVAPGPMLMVEPTVETAKKVSKQRVAPMIEATDVLRTKISVARSRDSGNTMFEKEFPGGILMMTGANSAVGLRSMPIRYLFLDEIDGYPLDVDGEGDPTLLAEKRTGTFARRKIFKTSTPTIKGLSRIEADYLASDQRRFYLPCPHCGFFDFITWERIVWQDGNPRDAGMKCTACPNPVEERHKGPMLERGEWRATAKGDPRIAGFHLSALYAPLGWKSWGEAAEEFLRVKAEPKKLQTWINTVLGETWEEKGDAFDWTDLQKRVENYAAEVPNGVGVLTAAVDVQGDRLELAVKGWGEKEESWLIALDQVQGDPAKADVWFELDKLLQQGFRHQSGRRLVIRRVAVDSGGLHTEHVYRFCKPRAARRVFGELQNVYPIKGVGGSGREILGRPSSANRYRVKLFPLGVDTAKDTIFSRMHIEKPAPGYLHLPAWADNEYLAQLTSEKAIRKYKKGIGTVREYIKIRDRNEGLDLEVYALAALYMLGRPALQQLGRWARELAVPLGAADLPPEDDPPAGGGSAPPAPSARQKFPVSGRQKSWVNRWK